MIPKNEDINKHLHSMVANAIYASRLLEEYVDLLLSALRALTVYKDEVSVRRTVERAIKEFQSVEIGVDVINGSLDILKDLLGPEGTEDGDES